MLTDISITANLIKNRVPGDDEPLTPRESEGDGLFKCCLRLAKIQKVANFSSQSQGGML
jgi:hypothetical protein